MASKQTESDRLAMLKHMSTIPACTILRHLREDTILEIAPKCFEDIKKENNMTQYPGPTQTFSFLDSKQDLAGKKGSGKLPGDRAKRPLNAFIAFRSFYVKLFPESQQKAASGFLTTLWNKDPFRNRWALIAKVYSFVRDELGKIKTPLSSFLETACPAMDVLHPDEYLQVLGWVLEDTGSGTKKLVQKDGPRTLKEPTKICPDSELGLLQEMIAMGYMPNENIFLLEAILAQNSRSAPTSTISIAEHTAIKTGQELQLENTPELTPEPAQELPALQTDYFVYTSSPEASTPYCGTSPGSDETGTPPTCASISTSPIPPAALSFSTPASTPDVISSSPMDVYDTDSKAAAVLGSCYRPYYYHFVADDSVSCPHPTSFDGHGGATAPCSLNDSRMSAFLSPAILRFDGVADHQAFDIDCPWDVDGVLNQCTEPQGAERVFVLSSGPDYDPHEDFHYTF